MLISISQVKSNQSTCIIQIHKPILHLWDKIVRTNSCAKAIIMLMISNSSDAHATRVNNINTTTSNQRKLAMMTANSCKTGSSVCYKLFTLNVRSL